MNEKNTSFKINGIISEYNPFHNGHKYHLDNARSQTGADYTIVVLGGNFTQRGTPALLDKFSRAKMALLGGADLVLELPSYYSASSAEYFATGAVTLLDKLGVTDYLCFGSECGNVSILEKMAEILLEEPEDYKVFLKKNLRSGLSYPLARTNALIEYCPELSGDRDVLSSSNNILGIEYIKALKRRSSSIRPVTTLRTSSNYHDRMLGMHQSSSLALRHALYDGKDPKLLAAHMPDDAFAVLREAFEQNQLLEANDLSSILHYKLLSEANDGYTHYLDVSAELSDRIRNNLYYFDNFRGFCDLLKTKNMTYTRISRCLLHILLDMENSAMEHYKRADYIFYARVLGFKKSAEPLLGAIKAHSTIPLLTKLSDADQLLSGTGMSMLRQEIRIGSVYESVRSLKSGCPMSNEYSTPLVMIG